jgi:hypothetical protein
MDFVWFMSFKRLGTCVGAEYSACGGRMKMEAKLKTKQKQKRV